MSVKIRAAHLDDFADITRIYGHHVLNGVASFEVEPPSRDEMIDRFRKIMASGFPYLVMTNPQDHVLGYAYLSSYRTRFAYRFSVENTIYLDPDCVGQGLGLQLLQFLLETPEADLYHQVIAVVGVDPTQDLDRNPSIRLHQKAGFEKCGHFKACGRKFGRWLDTVFLQKTLASTTDMHFA